MTSKVKVNRALTRYCYIDKPSPNFKGERWPCYHCRREMLALDH